MKKLFPIPLAIAFVLLLGSANSAQACLCNARRPVCTSYWGADAAFVGLVTSVSPDYKDRETAGRVGRRAVVFALEQAFRGVSGNEVILESPISDCDIEFEQGQRYFVYAYRDPSTNALGTNACTRTTRLANAAEDLAYVRSLAEGNPELLISGVVVEGIYDLVKNLQVTVAGNGKHYKAETDPDGRFKVVVDAPGNYVVRIILPRGYEVDGISRSNDLIGKVFTTRGRAAVEFEIKVEAGKCIFFDVPAFPLKRGSSIAWPAECLPVFIHSTYKSQLAYHRRAQVSYPTPTQKTDGGIHGLRYWHVCD